MQNGDGCKMGTGAKTGTDAKTGNAGHSTGNRRGMQAKSSTVHDKNASARKPDLGIFQQK